MTIDLRYPIGRRDTSATPTPESRRADILDIVELPRHLRAAVAGLTDDQLDTPYRPEGWTVRQVVHHLADSHLHASIRTRFALTVDRPTIMAYDENAWAQLKDARSGPLEPSLLLLEGLHARWAALLESLTDADWMRTFIHPERGVLTLDMNIPIYAWHGKHHTAHITGLRRRMNWG